VAVENEELARVSDQEPVPFDALALLALWWTTRASQASQGQAAPPRRYALVCCDQPVNLLELERESAPQHRLVAHDGSFDRLFVLSEREWCARGTDLQP